MRWGAENRIHDFFPDRFPELRERYLKKVDTGAYYGVRECYELRPHEYNLGTRKFCCKSAGDSSVTTLRNIFRGLDKAITMGDIPRAQVRPRHWGGLSPPY